MKKEQKKTGYPSIDKPWLNYYDRNFLSHAVPKQTLYQGIYQNNKNHLADIALQFYGNKITYCTMFSEIDRVCNSLTMYGIKRGDNISFFTTSCPEMAYAFLAVNKLGAVANMINPTFTPDQICNRINDTNSKIIFILDQLYDRIKDVIDKITPTLKVIIPIEQSMPLLTKLGAHLKLKKFISYDESTINWSHFTKKGKHTEKCPENTYESNWPAVVVYSSGTTGASKGIVLTNDGINATINHYTSTDFTYQRGDRFLHMGAPWLSTVIVIDFLMPLYMGISVILEPIFSEKTFADGIIKNKPEMTLSTISHWLYFIHSKEAQQMDLSFFKYPISGGEKVLPETEKLINDFFKDRNSSARLLIGYGMCELGSTVTTNSQKFSKRGSVGYPIKGVTVAAFDPERNLELPYGKSGEIRVLTPCRMKEYYKRPDATADFFWRDDNGMEWGCTGDVGYVDEDGFIFVQGRIDDTFIGIDGEKHYCFDIEDVILKHSAVDQCEVVGVEGSDGYDLLFAYIVKKKETTKSDEQIILELQALCEEKMESGFVPKKFVVLTKFPVKASGKRDMEQLKEMAKEYNI